MNKKHRKIIYVLLAIGAVFIIINLSANYYLKSKIETLIQSELPTNMLHSYDDIELHTFSGSVTLKNPSLIIKNKTDSLQHTFIKMEKFEISGASFWDYLMNNEIHIRSVVLVNPKIAYFKDRVNPDKDTVQPKHSKSQIPIYVGKVQIQNSSINLYEKKKDSTKLYVKGFWVEIEELEINDKTIARKIPFDYKNYMIKGDSIFTKLSSYDNLTVGDFNIDNGNARFNRISLKTKYSKKELSRIISKERDHYKLNLASLIIDEMDIDFENDTLHAKSKKISLNSPSFEVYRDKLVADDLSIKPLYSKMLRDLPIHLSVDSVKIANANIIYEERVKSENMGGLINFEKLDIDIANLSNTYKTPIKTELNIKGLFMDKTPLTAYWAFDVNNPNDHFEFRAEVGKMLADKMNNFTEPNLNVMLKGEVEKTYFTIDANNAASTTNLKIDYTDFKVEILRKNSDQKNKLLSAVVNIFVSKDSEKKDNYYREATAEATRDKTKSVFNFLWISLESALKKAMIGGK